MPQGRLPVTSSIDDDDPRSLRPLASPAYEEVPMWNILPSYQLYESTFSKNIDPLSEAVSGAPPLYEAATSPATPEAQRSDYFGAVTSVPNRWENSILGNTHRLKQLLSLDPQLADLLKIDVSLTSGPGKRGVRPTLYDGQDFEFLQGDLIHGYVTIQNRSRLPLPFDMFSVVFEGRITVNGDENDASKKPIVFYKFLNMFDYQASWTPAYLADSLSESDCIDPIDGTRLMFPSERLLAPNVVYKKFFNFTIPDHLLDCSCEVHELLCHCQMLPSIGLDKEQFLQRLRKMRVKPANPQAASFSIGGPAVSEKKSLPIRSKRTPVQSFRVRDFCFPDTAISYCVEARVVGKLSDYGGSPNGSKDEYIMVKESNAPVRLMPQTFSESDDASIEAFFSKFSQSIQLCIAMGRQLELGETTPLVRRNGSVVKNLQLFTPSSNSLGESLSESDLFESMLPYKKKSLTQTKVVGMFHASTPKRDYTLLYCPSFGSKPLTSLGKIRDTKMRFPLTITYSNVEQQKNLRPPEIKTVCAEIVACTVRSKKYPIPVEFTTNMAVGTTYGNDGFEKSVTKPFSRYLKDIVLLSSKFDPTEFNASPQTIMDVKSLAQLGVKYNNLRISDVVAKSAGGLARWQEVQGSPGKFTKLIEVEIDIKNLFAKEKSLSEDMLAQPVCLVPTFQSCIACRFYYVTVYVKFHSGDPLALKVAVKIEN